MTSTTAERPALLPGNRRNPPAGSRVMVYPRSNMPVYTCTTTTSTLTADIKGALAHEISRIHAEINHVPSTYVNVVFHELPAGGIYTDGVPANPGLVNGWVRSVHPGGKTPCLPTENAAGRPRDPH